MCAAREARVGDMKSPSYWKSKDRKKRIICRGTSILFCFLCYIWVFGFSIAEHVDLDGEPSPKVQILGVGKNVKSDQLATLFDKFPPSIKIVCCHGCGPCEVCTDYTNVCVHDTTPTGGTRVHNIATSRNMVLDHMVDTAPMVAIVDLDLQLRQRVKVGYWKHNKVMTFGQVSDYYDTWAFRDGFVGENFVVKGHASRTITKIKKHVRALRRPTEVYSAFGGVALLYPIPPRKCRYLESDDDCEHVKYNACLRKHGMEIIVDTSIKLIAYPRHAVSA